MKHILVILIFLLAGTSLPAVVIHSTPAGGNWMSASTWVGGIVPGSADDALIDGPVSVDNHVTCNSLTVNSNGILKNGLGLNWTITSNTDFTNYGMVTDNTTGTLSLYVNRHFALYGYIDNERVVLTATGVANIYQDSSADAIYCANFQSWSGPADYQMLSDLRFNGCMVDFYQHTVHMSHAGNDFGISVSGGRLYRAVLDSVGFGSLTLGGMAYLYSVTAADTILRGQVLYYQDVAFQDLTVEEGCSVNTLNAGGFNLYVYGDLVCRGSIQSLPGDVYLRLFGGFYNYSAANAAFVYFMNSTQQPVYQHPAAMPFDNNTFGKPSTVNAGDVVLLSDIRFVDTNVDMNNRNLICHSGGIPRAITLSGGKLYRCGMPTQGYSILSMAGGAYLDHVTAGDFILQGTARAYQSVQFDGLVNQGTLQGYNGVNYLTITGDMQNWGTIENGAGANLYLYLQQDLYVRGSITCQRVNFSGPGDQYARLSPLYPIASPDVFLLSNWGPAQFLLNGVPQSTGFEYYDIAPPFESVWQVVAGTNQRSIAFGLGTGAELAPPQIISFAAQDEALLLQWNEVPGAFFYSVWESAQPYGGFGDFTRVFDANIGDGTVSWPIIPASGQRFFRVVAED